MSICATCKHVRYCEIVENGYSSRVKSCKDYIPNKQTHFQQITASPEALAEWLDNTFDYCQAMWHWQCDKCTWSKKNESCVGDKEKWLEWFKQESNDG